VSPGPAGGRAAFRWLWLAIPIGLLVAAVAYRVGHSLPAALESAEQHGLTWVECGFAVPDWQAVHCGVMAIDGESEIPVAVIRRSLWRRDPKPLLFVNGGPGAATLPPAYSLESWNTWADLRELDRDLVLFDFLGTGHSRPSYACAGFDSVQRRILAQDLTHREAGQAADPWLRECHDRLIAAGRDLSKLALPDASRQVAALIASLPEVEWDVYAISHGTRVALDLMREPPPNLRRVVLDSVLPTDIDFELSLPRLTHDALQALFDSCEGDLRCTSAFGDLEALFYELKAKLDREPIEFSVVAFPDEAPIDVVLNGPRLVELVFSSMYWWQDIERLPNALWAAHRGDTESLEPLVASYVANLIDPSFNWIVFVTDGCSDRRAGNDAAEFERAARAYPRLYDLFEGVREYDACRFWKVPRQSPSIFEPVHSDLPTLLLAGSLDPVTPPRWARRVAKTLADSQLFEMPGIGHGVVDSDDCGAPLMRSFLADEIREHPPDCIQDTSGVDFEYSDRDS